MKDLPKVNLRAIIEQNEQMKKMVQDGSITGWLDSQLRELSQNNGDLYKFVIDHAQKFAMSVGMSQDTNQIALSQALESVMLLKLICGGLEIRQNLVDFEQRMQKLLKGENLEGLDDFGKGKKNV
jgi:hypothetical protein